MTGCCIKAQKYVIGEVVVTFFSKLPGKFYLFYFFVDGLQCLWRLWLRRTLPLKVVLFNREEPTKKITKLHEETLCALCKT